MGAVGGVDRTQRRFTVLGFPLAVIYKFFDDQGNVLAAGAARACTACSSGSAR